MYSTVEVVFLGFLLLTMAYFTLRFLLDKPKMLQYFAMVVNMPLYIVTLIALVLMFSIPFSSGYLLMVFIFRIMLFLVLMAEIALLALSIYLNRVNRKQEVHTIQLS